VSMSAAETDGLYATASSLRTSSAAAQHTAAGDSSLAHPHHQHNQQQQQQQASGPHFGPITELTMQPIGTAADGSSSSSKSSSSNPVITWHNEFVGVRHAGYAALQQTLWGRSQDRARARGEPAAAALLSKGLLLQLAQSGGRFQPGWIPGACVWCLCAAGCGCCCWGGQHVHVVHVLSESKCFFAGASAIMTLPGPTTC
jgi:hypothetical protein